MRRRLMPVLAALALAAGTASADQPAGGPDAVFTSPQGTVPGATPPQPLLMNLLEQVGVGRALEDADVRLFGHIEGSYTYNFDDPSQDLNLGRVFDLKNNRPTLNQIDFNVERPVDLAAHHWDVGGRVELLYGSDARFIHSSGMFDNDDFFHGPEYQFDIPQAYFDLGVPLGNGVRIRAGKFLFFKQIDPNASVFYSHSFSFGAAMPFTLTGITGYYPIDQHFSVEAGISRGWDQTLRDNNGAIDGMGRVRYDVNDRLGFTLAAIVGPELAHDNSHYRETLDFTTSFAATDRLTLLLDAVFGTQAEPHGAGNANWYGAAGYLVYRINEYLSAAGRLEWYRDEEGFTTALRQTLYEATIGVTITPFPHDPVGANFKLRPELRGDYASRRFFDGLTRHDQWTFGVDGIFNF